MTAAQNPMAAAVKQAPAYQSRDLFRGGKVVIIVHAGREYRLRVTRTGKLILTA